MLKNKFKTKKITLFPLLILLATIILGVALAANTLINLQREKDLMERFLRREGLNLIRAFEAGTRNSLIRRSQLELESLLKEAAAEGLMAYVVIANADRQIAATAGQWEGPLEHMPIVEALEPSKIITRFTKASDDRRVLEIGRRFDPLRALKHDHQFRNFGASPIARNLVAFVGLYTEEFDKERRRLVVSSLFQGSVLSLLGSAGLLLLFLTQRNRVQRATLQNMELYTRNIIDCMPNGLLAVDGDGRVVSDNEQVRELLAVDRPNLEGMSLCELLGGGSDELSNQICAGAELVDEMLDYRRPDGEAVPLKISSSKLVDRDGDSSGMVLILRDLREIKAMEEQLERSRRHAALGQMAAGIAHEIRNPLGTLRGFAEYFAELKEVDAGAGEFAGLMIDEVDRLNRNVSALLQYARPREPEIQRFELATLLEKCRRLVEADAQAKNVQLQVMVEPNQTCDADPDLLTQILLNLLQNALAVTDEGGIIRLSASEKEGATLLTVADNGRGMTEEVRQRMFDPFFTTRKSGTGLGLAVVHQIIEQHQGSIGVESAPGNGTRIHLIFPRHEVDDE